MRTKWSIFFPETGKYVSGHNGCLAWTTNLDEALKTAHHMKGMVVKTNWLSKHWHEWRKTGIIPKDATPNNLTITHSPPTDSINPGNPPLNVPSPPP